MKSVFVSKRAWFGGVALLSATSIVACGDEGGDGTDTTAGKASGGTAGKAGSPNHGGGDGVTPSGGTTSGSGGKAGNAGSAATDGGMGGEDSGITGGEGGVGGLGGATGEGGEGGEPVVKSLPEQVREMFAGMSPLPAVPADTTNAFADNAAAATFGQRLFFDEKFSGPMTATGDTNLGAVNEVGKVSCASCHSGPALDDERSDPATVSKGTGLHTRNSPAVVNSAFYAWTNWGGRFSAQWELPLVVVENGAIMNGNRLALVHRIRTEYETDYEAVFGAIPDEVAGYPASGKPGVAEFDNLPAADKTIVNRILVNYSKALQAYMRKLVSREAPFDLLMAGDDNAMSEAEMRGALLFGKNGCMECHSGPTFSDQKFHDLGVPQTGANVPATDEGRFANTPALTGAANLFNRDGDFSDDKNTGKLQTIPNPIPDSWKGAFRTPSLRGVALTAPYMHSGQLATLSDVLDFYEIGVNANTGAGEPLPDITISLAEKADMIAFLGSLTGKPVDAALVQDTSDPD
jgi:cytochrome c peroxidase